MLSCMKENKTEREFAGKTFSFRVGSIWSYLRSAVYQEYCCGIDAGQPGGLKGYLDYRINGSLS